MRSRIHALRGQPSWVAAVSMSANSFSLIRTRISWLRLGSPAPAFFVMPEA